MAALKLKMESGWMNILSHIFCKADPFHSLFSLFFNDTFTKFSPELHITCMQCVIFPVRSHALTSRCNVRPYRTQSQQKRKVDVKISYWSAQKRRMRHYLQKFLVIWQFSLFLLYLALARRFGSWLWHEDAFRNSLFLR